MAVNTLHIARTLLRHLLGQFVSGRRFAPQSSENPHHCLQEIEELCSRALPWRSLTESLYTDILPWKMQSVRIKWKRISWKGREIISSVFDNGNKKIEEKCILMRKKIIEKESSH